MANANVNTAVQGNNAMELNIINPNRKELKRKAIRKAKLRRQHAVGKLCLLFTAACFAIGATILPEIATAGLLFVVPGLMLTFSRKVW